MGVGGSAPRPGRFTPRKDLVPIVQETGWAPEPVWKGTENLVPTGIRSPDRPARSKPLYWLSYRGRTLKYLDLELNVQKNILILHICGNLWVEHCNIFRTRKTFTSGVKFEAVAPAFEVSKFVRSLAHEYSGHHLTYCPVVESWMFFHCKPQLFFSSHAQKVREEIYIENPSLTPPTRPTHLPEMAFSWVNIRSRFSGINDWKKGSRGILVQILTESNLTPELGLFLTTFPLSPPETDNTTPVMITHCFRLPPTFP